MKAIILAGGVGSRLKPLTDTIPKALVPINKKTLTEHVIEILKKYDVSDIILSVGHMAEQIKEKLGDGGNLGVTLSYVEEKEPLGTAGPLIMQKKQGEELKETFLMLNGDNLFDIDLNAFIAFHKKRKALATIALTQVENPSEYGVAVQEGEKIVEFVEKPKNPPSSYINSGYYVLEPEVFDLLEGKERAMMEKDVFPILAQKGLLYGYSCDGLWFDTGTPKRYEEVKLRWHGV